MKMNKKQNNNKLQKNIKNKEYKNKDEKSVKIGIKSPSDSNIKRIKKIELEDTEWDLPVKDNPYLKNK